MQCTWRHGVHHHFNDLRTHGRRQTERDDPYRHTFVRQCVVVKEKVNGNSRLAAYLVAESLNTPTISELRQYLSRSLPEHMVPAVLVVLDKKPLDHNGKVDQSCLQFIRKRVKPPGGRAAHANHLECKLETIWEEVFGIEPIGLCDSIFDLGGHSLMVFRIAARIERAIGERLPDYRVRGADDRMARQTVDPRRCASLGCDCISLNNVNVENLSMEYLASNRNLGDQFQQEPSRDF